MTQYNIDKSTACCFTGHREIDKTAIPRLHVELCNTICALYKYGYRTFICGGAKGFDTIAALEVITARHHFPGIRLVLILPYEKMWVKWDDTAKAVYRRVRLAADEVIALHFSFTYGCMHERNLAMLENSSACITYHDGRPSGGTTFTRKRAIELSMYVIDLYGKVNEKKLT